jgi:nucleotide-binding universal stress UspA family protein
MSGPYRDIIVGTDGSTTATAAVRAAAVLARACNARLVVATAWYRHLHEAPSRAEQAMAYGDANPTAHEATWASETVSDAAGIARSHGVGDVTTATPTGNAADVLCRLGDEYPDSLIVVGTVGLGSAAERLVGNVPHQLTHHSNRDLFLISRPQTGEPAWTSVALATDGSPTAGIAVSHGHAVARCLGAAASLLTVARNEEHGAAILDDVAATLGAPDVGRQVVVGSNDIAGLLGQAARDYDLLVIGNKGMSGPSRLLGSVSNRVTHRVPTDILLANTTR